MGAVFVGLDPTLNTTQTSLMFFRPLSHTPGAQPRRWGNDSLSNILQRRITSYYNIFLEKGKHPLPPLPLNEFCNKFSVPLFFFFGSGMKTQLSHANTLVLFLFSFNHKSNAWNNTNSSSDVRQRDQTPQRRHGIPPTLPLHQVGRRQRTAERHRSRQRGRPRVDVDCE